MNNDKFCPECGEKIEDGERFCPNCGTEIPAEKKTSKSDSAMIGAGARANVTGGLHKTQNTSNVDNSSTVNHNTTYVMNNKSEYCEVCGNPLEEKHAKCPKCGKEICPDCRVKGKNRCIECEKKAIDDFRTTLQQLLLTTNGNIGIAGRQLINQKARELDLEDKKESIVNELAEIYKPTVRAEQPDIIPAAATIASSTITQNSAPEAKGVNLMDERRKNIADAQKKSSGSGKIIGCLIGIAVNIAIIVAILNACEKNETTPENKQATTTEATAPAQEEKAATPQKTQVQKIVEEVKPAVTEVKAVEEKKSDPNYEKGVKAFDNDNGRDAIKYLTRSGSADAYYMLGVIYEQGCGTIAKNPMKARQNYKKAAEMGNTDAKNKLK